MTAGPAATIKSIPWGNLFWALPLAYVFVDPYQTNAQWLEWTVTAAALAVLLTTFLLFTMHIDKRNVIRGLAFFLLPFATALLIYRPSFGIFFPMVAVFLPFAFGERILLSSILITGVAAIYIFECSLLNAPVTHSLFSIFVIAQTFLAGGGMMYAVRQRARTKRLHQTTERERIATDLHDVLGQTLSSIALKAELSRRLFHVDPTRALTEISDIERVSRQALHEVRAAIHGYHAGDIRSELKRVTSMLEAARISVDCSCADVDIPPSHERVIALVLREAATNIVRHSKATTARVVVQQSNTDCRLEVLDNGVGGSFAEGLGMRSIRTRIEAIGGTVQWDVTQGTHLTVAIPISADKT